MLSMGTRITGGATFLSLILLPIYATGNERGITTEEFNLLTIARVESDGSSWRLYVTVVVWYIFILGILHEFWYEWKMYYTHRTVFDATGDLDMPLEYRYTVRLEQIPNNINQSDTQLRKYMEHLFPNQIYETSIIVQTKALELLMTQRHKIILKLEACQAAAMVASTKTKPKPPKQIKIKGQKVDAIPYYQSEVERYNQEIDTLRTTIRTLGGLSTTTNTVSSTSTLPLPTVTMITPSSTSTTMKANDLVRGPSEEGVETGFLEPEPPPSEHLVTDNSPSTSPPPPNTTTTTTARITTHEVNQDTTNQSQDVKVTTSTAFVTFTSLRAKQTALQCEWTGDPDSVKAYSAADPIVGTIWSNVTVPLRQQTFYQFVASCFFTVGILFWSLPVMFVTSISNLNAILEVLGWKQADPNVFWYGLVAGLLPVIMLAVLMIVLYMVITAAATTMIRYKSWPEVDAYCLYWHTLFQFANLWLILIGGSFFAQIDSIIEEPELKPIIETIASAMPTSSVFFVNMIVCSSFNAFGMELSMLVKYIVTKIMNLISPEASQTQRQLDDKKKPPSLVWGQKVPPIIFVFMVSILYSTSFCFEYDPIC
jgi:hypothetical protein